MKFSVISFFVFWLPTVLTHAADQPAPVDIESKATHQAENGTPIARLIAAIARKTGKKFIVDPRVSANIILAGEEPSEITYPQFLTVLEVYGFIAVDDGGLVRILPDANMRQEPIPVITSKDTRAASECVTQIVTLKYVPAAQLVPILRPMLPQYAHLAALPLSNSLIIADRFANVRRIEALARLLDTPENRMPPVKEPEHQ